MPYRACSTAHTENSSSPDRHSADNVSIRPNPAEIPNEDSHTAAGLARMTIDLDGSVFNYERVLGGLFKVFAVQCKHRPAHAAVAVHHLDYWYYIDERDHDSRSTFALVLHMSRVELGQTSGGGGPVLTLPLSAR
jgi:hypothetical protein